MLTLQLAEQHVFILTHSISVDTVAMLHGEARAGYRTLAVRHPWTLSLAASGEPEKQPFAA